MLRHWAESHGARTIVAVTSPIHSRRARLTLALAARSSGLAIAVHSCTAALAPGSLWWLDERPLVQVANEALKLALYTVRYFVPAWTGLGPAPGDVAQTHPK